MDATLITAIISFAGTVVGTLGGILITHRLTLYRVGKLEEAVKEYNNVKLRTYELEKQQAVHNEKIEFTNDRIDELEYNLRRFIPNERNS